MWGWINGNVWRIVIGVSISIILSVGGWTFSQVRDLPSKYVMKEDLNTGLSKMERSMDNGFDRLEKQIRELRKVLFELYIENNKTSE